MIASISLVLQLILFPPLPAIDNSGAANLGKSALVINDPTHHQGIRDVIALPDSAFRQGTAEIFNGNTIGKTWWFRFTYLPSSHDPAYLVLDYANIDTIDAYFRRADSTIDHIASGTFRPFESRFVISPAYILKFPIGGAPVEEVYLRLRSVNTLIAPIKILNENNLYQWLFAKYTAVFVCSGIILAVMALIVFLWYRTRLHVFLLYLIRIVCLFYLFILAYLLGYGHFFGEAAARFILIHAHAFAAIGYIATILFNNTFLDIRRTSPKYLVFFNVLIVAWAGVFFLSLYDNRFISNRIAQVLILASSISILYTSCRVIFSKYYERKNTLIYYYAIGWIPVLVASIYVVLTLLNVLPLKDYTFKVIIYAGVLEGVLISMAMVGERFYLLQQAAVDAESENVRIIQERNQYLKEKIEERTIHLNDTISELEEANKVKDKMFSIISHDLRTPLSNLTILLAMTEQNIVSADKIQEILASVRKKTLSIQSTLDNLLGWAVSQMGNIDFRQEIIRLEQFIDDHLVNYENVIAHKQIRLETRHQIPATVLADKNQLSLIIRNLIDNAVKFTPIGGQVLIQVVRNGAFATFCIENTGEGLSEEMIHRIKSSSITPSSTKGTANEKGIGLGLRLCQEFIRNINSELHITSSETKSVIFSFHIPLSDHPGEADPSGTPD